MPGYDEKWVRQVKAAGGKFLAAPNRHHIHVLLPVKVTIIHMNVSIRKGILVITMRVSSVLLYSGSLQ
jgi:hypothetical protein